MKHLKPDEYVQTTSVPAFSTIATGFWIAQYSLHNPASDLAVYANTAPRKHDSSRQAENCGEKLVYAELANGVPVFTVNSGHSLSFVRDAIQNLYEVETSDSGSQFRSRDFFPEAIAGIMEDDQKYVGRKLDPSAIPNIPDRRIAFIDGYGNIKTTVRESELCLKTGTRLDISIDGKVLDARYEDNTFEVGEGELSFAPGSSGGEEAFLEVFLRGGSAAKKFGSPEAGDKIEIEKKATV